MPVKDFIIIYLFPIYFFMLNKVLFITMFFGWAISNGKAFDGSYKPSVLATMELPLVAPQPVTLNFLA